MKLGTFNIAIFLCFIFRKGVSVRVFIVDIPDDDINTLSDNDYAYNDYDQIIPIQEVPQPTPQHTEKLELKLHTNKKFCKRFGSMYGKDTYNHKCDVLLRIKERNKRQNGNISEVVVKPSASIDLDRQNFAQDYVDNIWRSASDPPSCTTSDIINNKCNSDALDRSKSNGFSDSKSDKNRDAKKTGAKEFSQDYVDNFWRGRILKNDPLNRFSGAKPTQEKEFSRDYTDDFWRSTSLKNVPITCTLRDIINNKCELSLDVLNRLKPNRVSDSKSVKDRGVKPTQGKEFSHDYIDDFWRSTRLNKNDHVICTLEEIVNKKCKLSLNALNRLKPNRFSDSKSDTRVAKTKQGKEISQDYVDIFWRSPNDLPNCTISDIINKKCKLNIDAPNQLKSRLDSFINSKKDEGKESTKGKVLKPKSIDDNGQNLPLFANDYIDFWRSTSSEHGALNYELDQIINNSKSDSDASNLFDSNSFSDSESSNELNIVYDSISNNPNSISRRNNLIQFRPNQFKSVFRSSRYTDTDESEKSSASEEEQKKKKPKRFQIVKNKKSKTKTKKSKKELSESEADNTYESTKSSDENKETLKSSAESVIFGNVKFEQSDIENDLTDLDEIDTSDSFETGPKKASDKYTYLQGHRLINPKNVKAGRRASRLQTFLLKRFFWKPKDVHELGYYWFDGPKGPFPSDYN